MFWVSVCFNPSESQSVFCWGDLRLQLESLHCVQPITIALLLSVLSSVPAIPVSYLYFFMVTCISLSFSYTLLFRIFLHLKLLGLVFNDLFLLHQLLFSNWGILDFSCLRQFLALWVFFPGQTQIHFQIYNCYWNLKGSRIPTHGKHKCYSAIKQNKSNQK